MSAIYFFTLHSLGDQASSLFNDPCHNLKFHTLESAVFIATGMSPIRTSRQKRQKKIRLQASSGAQHLPFNQFISV